MRFVDLDRTAHLLSSLGRFLPRSPETAPFLTNEEREYVVSALKHSGSVSADDDKDRFSWTEVVRTAKSLHVWLLAVARFFSGTMAFGLAYFEPTIDCV
ncbi:hypothetical protein V8E55_007011 [Tylopilus felleus]